MIKCQWSEGPVPRKNIKYLLKFVLYYLKVCLSASSEADTLESEQDKWLKFQRWKAKQLTVHSVSRYYCPQSMSKVYGQKNFDTIFLISNNKSLSQAEITLLSLTFNSLLKFIFVICVLLLLLADSLFLVIFVVLLPTLL